MSEPVAVLGAGAGGLAVARGLAQAGRPVTLVSEGPVFGDPSLLGKWLVDLAREGHPEALVELRRRRLRRIESAAEGLSVRRGRVRFLEPYLLEVQGPDGGRIEARTVVIATGSQPVRVEIPGLPPGQCLTTDDLYELERPPAHLVVVGSGIIALESACAFRRLGSRVTLLARSGRLLSRESPAVSVALGTALAHQGVDVRLDVRPFLFAEGTLQLRPEGIVEDVDAVLLAVGRRPRVEELELDRAGLPHCPEGLEVDEWCRTVIRGLYAVGEVTGSRFSHTARAQARHVVAHIVGPGWARPPAWLVPWVTYSDPEVASVRAAHPAPLRRTLFVALSELDRGLTEGFVELEVEPRTGHVQSATLVAPRASEGISLFTLAIQENIPLSRLARVVYPYPTVSEAVAYLAEQL